MSPDRRQQPDRRQNRAPANIRPKFQRLPDGRAWVTGFHLPGETADLVERANEAHGDGDVYDYVVFDLLPFAARHRLGDVEDEDEMTAPAT